MFSERCQSCFTIYSTRQEDKQWERLIWLSSEVEMCRAAWCCNFNWALKTTSVSSWAWLRWKHFHLGRRPWVSSIYSNARTAFDTLNLHDSEGEITLNNARAHMLMWAYFPVMREISWVEKCWSSCWLLAFRRLNESLLDELELLREFWVTNLIKELAVKLKIQLHDRLNYNLQSASRSLLHPLVHPNFTEYLTPDLLVSPSPNICILNTNHKYENSQRLMNACGKTEYNEPRTWGRLTQNVEKNYKRFVYYCKAHKSGSKMECRAFVCCSFASFLLISMQSVKWCSAYRPTRSVTTRANSFPSRFPRPLLRNNERWLFGLCSQHAMHALNVW